VLKPFITDQFEEPQTWENDLKSEVSKYLPMWKADMEKFKQAVSLEQQRITVLSELPYSLAFFYEEKLNWTDTDWNTKNHTKAEIANALEEVTKRLEVSFNGGKTLIQEKWEPTVRSYADELGWKHGDLFLAIRSAVTGKLQSPPLLESIEVLGWEKAKQFMSQAVMWLRS
jgi:glutamyl-tRNA synthetase